MKKISLALIVSSLLASASFADQIDTLQIPHEQNIHSLQSLLDKDPANSEALFEMAVFYGSADHLDVVKQHDYLKKSADLHLPEAEMQYGFLLLNDGQVKEGLAYIKQAAEQGYVKALTLLGDLYFAGYQNQAGEILLQSDVDLSEQYLKQAVAQNDSEARYTLAYLYLDPNLSKQDIQKAIELFESNIDYVNKNAHLASVIALIDVYSKGEYVAVNQAKLVDYFYLASLKDYLPALYPIGMMQREGAKGERLEIVKDLNSAFTNLNKAANAGYIDAMFRIGEMYFKGEGIEQSDRDAYIWMSVAEELSANENKYSETILELVPKKEREAVVDQKNQQLKLFVVPNQP